MKLEQICNGGPWIAKHDPAHVVVRWIAEGHQSRVGFDSIEQAIAFADELKRAAEDAKPRDRLSEREFYDVCQGYRYAPPADLDETSNAHNALKRWIRAHAAEIAAYEAAKVKP